MMTPLIDYTISSYDYNHYNRIDINLPSPPSCRVSMIVTSLITKCSIVVIERSFCKSGCKVPRKAWHLQPLLFTNDSCHLLIKNFIIIIY